MRLSGQIIGMAIDVHRQLGPGLFESAYESCLCFDPAEAGIAYARQVPLPLHYKGVRLNCGYRMDIVVDDKIVVEVKAVQRELSG